jgi:DGQHR domain-containing protein
MATTRKRRRKRRKKPTPQELEQRNHRSDIRAVFRNAGFIKVLSVSDKEFTFLTVTSDFDDVFVFENVIVLAEYTTRKSDNISPHLKSKKIVYDKILENKNEFLEFFENTFGSFKDTRDGFYDYGQCHIVILYCSRNSISESLKKQVPNVKYLDYPILRYFKSVSHAVKRSSRFELFSFLELKYDDIGRESINPSVGADTYEGSILPESHSNFSKGYKVVSFYIDPESLLSRGYVLRKGGWKHDEGLYQRIVSNAKILSIRRYLNSNERVFINNIIVTLPDDTKLIDQQRNTVDPSALNKTSSVTIQIPKGFNTIGIIDGQHRIFSYHEGGHFEEKIGRLRVKQNLLVTGIIYPSNVSDMDKTKFEANLFLEINKNQTKVRSDLTQAIGLLLKPFSSESIATSLLRRLNDQGPMEDVFARHFYDKDKLRTTSIVSYGLKPIVKLSGKDSFYSIWDNENKGNLAKQESSELLEQYITFCATELNIFLAAVKQNIANERWTTDRKVDDRVLSIAVVNGCINCLRYLIENNKVSNFEYYSNKLSDMNNFEFHLYKASQYRRMGEALYKKYFLS